MPQSWILNSACLFLLSVQAYFADAAFLTTPGHCFFHRHNDGDRSLWAPAVALVNKPGRCWLQSSTQENRDASSSSTTRSLSSSLDLGDDDFEVRAGSDGYSVLRQPASRSNWDPDADPEFDLPVSWKDDDRSNMQSAQTIDNDWWSNRFVETKSAAARGGKIKDETAEVVEVLEKELDLFQRSLDTLDFPRILSALRKECTTAPAKKLVQEATKASDFSTSSKKLNAVKGKEQAFQPLIAATVEKAQERYRAVVEMQWLLHGSGESDSGDHVHFDDVYFRNRKGYKESIAGRPPPYSSSNFDLELIFQAVDKGRVLESEEILSISGMMDAMEDVLSWSDALQRVDGLTFVELPKLAGCIEVNATLHSLLQSAFDKDGRLSGNTFPTLGSLRARVRALRAEIIGTLDSLLLLPSIKSKLALESGGPLYSEVSGGRLVIPVESKHASSIGIVHDTSRSGKTVYVEPTEIVGTTNELRQAEGELRAEEARVWRLLTKEILTNRRSLETSVYAIGQLDLVVARLLLGRRISGVVPIVKDDGVISLRNAKHPVLLLRGLPNVVGSDVELGANGNQGLVLTGPNSGGKTIILKLLGLTALMARGGIPVPADARPALTFQNDGDEEDIYQPRIDFFDPVLADIGDLQSVGGDLSTFSGHMLVCREVLANARRNALVLMDEVGWRRGLPVIAFGVPCTVLLAVGPLIFAFLTTRRSDQGPIPNKE